ncbi:MAG: hypothetical protein ACJ76X_16915 [Solirubrobacteraceae bacterium]
MFLFTMALVAPASAVAAPSISFVAPPGAKAYADQTALGPAGYTEAPLAFRTADTRPTIAIKAEGGVRLVCHFDDVHVDQDCGSAPGSCGASICGSFQPATSLGNDANQFTPAHFLAVDLMDATDSPVASVWLNIDVDTTPPTTHLDNAHGVLTLGDANDNPLRPTFSYEITDSNSIGGNVDTAACSWTAASAAPAFRSCVAPRAGASRTISVGHLPRKHRLYRLQVRGTDDFGRSTSAAAVYDPIPCVLTIQRPHSIGNLLSSGVQTHLSCDTLRRVSVAVYAFMVNGDKSSSPRGAVADHPVLGEYKVNSRANSFRTSKRLKLFGGARSALRSARSIGLVLAAGEQDKITGGIADDSLSYQSFTLR